LEHAATYVPYYREQWAQRRRNGDRAAWDLLENWPVLPKDAVRRHTQAFLADDADPRKLFHEHTSGSTGTPLNLWLSRNAVRLWFALFEARSRNWYGVSRHDRWAIIGAQRVTPLAQTRPPFWVWNAGLNQLYLSPYHIAPQHVADYVRAMHQHRVVYLLGYASSMFQLALMIRDQGLIAPRLKVVISNAEPLLAHQRRVLSEVFNCPVRDTYGMAEIAAAASECEAGHMHLWPEVGVVEILDDVEDVSVTAGTHGRFICTGLINTAMPLIRYANGDRGALSSATGCQCGRTLPQLKAIAGRDDDVIIGRDGQRFSLMGVVFQGDLPMREGQIIQESTAQLRIRFVPDAGYTDAHGRALVKRIHDYMGPMDVRLEPVDHIPRGKNGKFRVVISTIA
jgi:phenylacetate-CoA ligase